MPNECYTLAFVLDFTQKGLESIKSAEIPKKFIGIKFKSFLYFYLISSVILSRASQTRKYPL